MDKQINMFKKEIEQVLKDVLRTSSLLKEQKYAEFIKILSKMLFFAVFCIRVIEENEKFPFPSVNDIRKELSGMQGLGEEQIRDIHESMKKQSTSSPVYNQGLNFFAGFFVTLYFLVNQKFGGNVNKKEIIDEKEEMLIDGKGEIIDESGIIKLFVFYLLHKWDCDSSVNYLPSCSLYNTCALIELPFFILLRRCKLLHMDTNYDFNKNLLLAFTGPLVTYSLSRTTNNNYCLDYIMYLDLHLYIVKKKILTFILIGLIFSFISFCILLRKRIWNIMVMVLILK